MRIGEEIAKMPEVRAAVEFYARLLGARTTAKAAAHRTMAKDVRVEPDRFPDWRVVYDAYDPKGRGKASSVEMGHINEPIGGSWTNGIHVLRDAAREMGVL